LHWPLNGPETKQKGAKYRGFVEVLAAACPLSKNNSGGGIADMAQDRGNFAYAILDQKAHGRR
jgi:hypothetical protein